MHGDMLQRVPAEYQVVATWQRLIGVVNTLAMQSAATSQAQTTLCVV